MHGFCQCVGFRQARSQVASCLLAPAMAVQANWLCKQTGKVSASAENGPTLIHGYVYDLFMNKT